MRLTLVVRWTLLLGAQRLGQLQDLGPPLVQANGEALSQFHQIFQGSATSIHSSNQFSSKELTGR